MKTYRVAVLAGDGIGPEVVASALPVLARAGEATGSFRLETDDLPWSSGFYLEHGAMMPGDGLMFDPVHGSAPKYAGKNVANPMACVWAGAMMLQHLGEREAGALVMRALEAVALSGPRTRDVGGSASTADVAAAIEAAIGQ